MAIISCSAISGTGVKRWKINGLSDTWSRPSFAPWPRSICHWTEVNGFPVLLLTGLLMGPLDGDFFLLAFHSWKWSCGHFIGYFNHQAGVAAQTPDMAHSDDLWHFSSVAFWAYLYFVRCIYKNIIMDYQSRKICFPAFSLASSLVYLCVDFQIRTNSK